MSSGYLDTLKDVFANLISPWLFMSISARHIPSTITTLISQGQWSTLLTPWSWAFNEAHFGNFWATVGPEVKNQVEPHVIPILEGRFRDGKVTDEVVAPPVSGTVIEVGAGSGMWADIFSKVGGSKDGEEVEGVRRRGVRPGSGLKKIYGIEPNPQSAAALRKRVKEVGLDGVYEVIPLGIESLSDPSAWSGTTIEPESVDCIVTILCLCSIPDQEQNIRELYKLLKPGGRWYVFEHVKVERGGILVGLYQRFLNLVWSFFVGSCRLCNPTGTNLRKAGPWSDDNLVWRPDEPTYKAMPHIVGILTK